MKTHWKSSEYAREKAHRWRLENPDRVIAYRKKNRRKSYLQEAKRKYGLEPEEFHRMMSSQKEQCATCKKDFNWGDKQTKPHIDHCHKSGVIRGILCNKCNTTLGWLSDQPDTLKRMAEYLECHGYSAKR